MFVKTQFETMVNLAIYSKINLQWYWKDKNTNNVFHKISAEIDQQSEPIMDLTGKPEYKSTIYSTVTTLALFPQDKNEQAQKAYDDLFNALIHGDSAFDMSGYIQKQE